MKNREAATKALHTAAKMNDYSGVSAALSDGADINALDDVDNGTALHQAASLGHKRIVKLLLDKGADVTLLDIIKNTVLYAAVIENHPDCVEIIVNHLIKKFKNNPVDLFDHIKTNWTFGRCLQNTVNERIRTALFKLFIHCLTSKVYIDNLWVLLPNPHGMKASYTKEIVSIAKALPLTVRASFCARLITGNPEFSPHLVMIYRKSIDELVKIKDSTDVNFLKKKLYEAAASGDIELAKICIDKGASVNEAVNWFYDLPIYVAAENGHADMVEFLIKNGADKNHRRTTGISKGKSIAHAAAENGHVDVLQVLFDKDSQLLKDESSYEVLRPAILNNQIETVKFLLEHDVLRPSCKPTQELWSGPLYSATISNRREILEMLTDKILTWPLQNILYFLNLNLFKSCMIHAMDFQKDTFTSLLRICEHLIKNGVAHQYIIQHYMPLLLTQIGKKFKNIILEQANNMTDEEASAWLGRILDPKDYLHYLVSIPLGLTKANVTHKNSTLYKAAEMKKAVDARIAGKAKENENDERELYTAAWNGKVDAINALLDKGTNINCRIINSFPLLAAASNGHDAAVKLLLERGADITLQTQIEGHEYCHISTLLIAAEKGHLNIVNMILASVKPCDAYAKCYEYGLNAALRCASEKGHLDIVNNIIHFMIYYFDADQMYSFLKVGNILRSSLQKANNDEIKQALSSLIPMLRKMNFSDKDLSELMPDGKFPCAEPVAVIAQPAAQIAPPQMQKRQSAIELAFTIDVKPAKLPEPLAPTPLSAIELAFTSVNIPHNLSEPMVPKKLSSTAIIGKQIGLPTPPQPVTVAEQVLPVAPQVNPRTEVKIQTAAQQEPKQRIKTRVT